MILFEWLILGGCLFGLYLLCSHISIFRKPFDILGYFIEQKIGYGSCIFCGKKRMSMWLLSCNTCYEKNNTKVGN